MDRWKNSALIHPDHVGKSCSIWLNSAQWYAIHPLSVNNWHLLLNQWASLNQTSQEWSLGCTNWKLFKESESKQNAGCHGRYTIRPLSVNIWHLLLNQWANLDQTSQEWSLEGTNWKLFKESESKQNSSCHGNQVAKCLNVFLPENIRPRATKFGM